MTVVPCIILPRRLGACPSNGALRGERRGQRRFEIQMVNFEKFHAAKQHQARLLGEPNPAPGSQFAAHFGLHPARINLRMLLAMHINDHSPCALR